jgi:hypothetical protein
VRIRRPRAIIDANALDFTSPGRRDYFVELEHPSIWGHYLIPLTVFVGPKAEPGRGLSRDRRDPRQRIRRSDRAQASARRDPRGGRPRAIVLVPVLNVPAFRAGRRDTPDDGMNLNRAFPGDR